MEGGHMGQRWEGGGGGGGGAQRSAGDGGHIGVCLLFFTFNFQSCTSH